jgi:hypothetical protein
MPHGAPKKFTAFRIDPELLAAVKERTSNVTQVVEEGLRWWLAREKRRRGGTEEHRSEDPGVPRPSRHSGTPRRLPAIA